MKKNLKEVFIMKNKINGLIAGVCTLVEIGCIIELARIGLKRNNECYKAELKLLEREADLTYATIDILRKDAEIAELKEQLKKYEEES
jgi:hypothetical protein